ncbi:hypothetical protein ABB07_36595 [Streptomyces incarnatus]|uniref:Gfo/Idh/MocA-like oxidoreductase N-terminal domain-containing protein n=1 Tax=Streptomyces incarnatus TaxID=665007 RepID=A0ABM5TWC4_9ACTN|nr:Gfo/Idh/MocA family oxidoreductase [Streptomyces incarnatus]AKJ15387.1 hypothetical protein ABB07_36595 [Streptomyces incarnatus]
MSVADVDEQRAARAAAVPGARATGDGQALIADPDFDAVVIASHDTTHADLAVAALRVMDDIRRLCGAAFPRAL